MLQRCRSSLGHHKSKPFIDHVLGFYLVDGRIWLRNFQISHMRESSNPEPVLAEIGARKNSCARQLPTPQPAPT